MDLENLPKGLRKYTRNTGNILTSLDPKKTLLILFIAGLLFRLLLLPYRFAVSFDEVNYLKLGVSAHLNGLGDAFHTYWSPFLPLLISFMANFFSDYEVAGRLVSVLAGSVLIFPVYFLGKYVYDRTVGLTAAAFVTFYPPLAFQSTLILTEPLYMFFLTASILYGLRMLREYAVSYAFLAGLTAGLAYLTHPQGFGLIALLVLWILIGSFFKLFLITKLRIVYLVVSLFIGFLLIAGGYLFYLKKTTGSWTLSAKGAANQQMEAYEGGEELDPFRALDPDNRYVVIDRIYHQGTFLQGESASQQQAIELKPLLLKYADNLYDMLTRKIPEALTLFPLILLGVGLFGGPWANQQGKMMLYLLSFIFFYWLFVVPLFHINLRYLTPLLPLCSLWIAKGFVRIYDWLCYYMPLARFSARKKIASSTSAFVIMVTAFVLLIFLPEIGRVMARDADSTEYVADPVEQKAAGKWLQEYATKSPVIMSRNHTVDIYAGNYDIEESVTVPVNEVERVLQYAKHRNVKFIVLNERYKDDYPKMNDLLMGKNIPPELKLIYREEGPAGLVTVIYEIVG